MIETADARGEICGRILADLGADVIKVEPPGGAPSRAEAPSHDGISLAFAVRNAGKRSVVVDTARADGREQLLTLLDSADIWIASNQPGTLPDRAARARNPALVVLAISDFGRTGPYRDWVATDPVLLAMGGVLSRSGLPGREPLVPPADMALALTAAQAAWAALVAYWNRLETGRGDCLDFSLYEATAQAIEPAMGTVGTAQAAGYEPTRGRPAPGPYPIFRCRDGHVRVVLLAPRQWQAMRAWLGDPDELRDPELETIRGRALAADRLHAIFERHFAGRSKHELTLEGQARGVPIAPVADTRRGFERRALSRPRRDRPAGVGAGDHRRGSDRVRRDRRAADRPGRLAPAVGEHDADVLAVSSARRLQPARSRRIGRRPAAGGAPDPRLRRDRVRRRGRQVVLRAGR